MCVCMKEWIMYVCTYIQTYIYVHTHPHALTMGMYLQIIKIHTYMSMDTHTHTYIHTYRAQARQHTDCHRQHSIMYTFIQENARARARTHTHTHTHTHLQGASKAACVCHRRPQKPLDRSNRTVPDFWSFLDSPDTCIHMCKYLYVYLLRVYVCVYEHVCTRWMRAYIHTHTYIRIHTYVLHAYDRHFLYRDPYMCTRTQ